MTEDEKDAEKLRVLERYSELQSTIECLRGRILRWHGYLSQIYTNIKGAKNLADCMPLLDNVVEGAGDVRIVADIDGLSKAIHERRQLEESLRRLNLGALIQRRAQISAFVRAIPAQPNLPLVPDPDRAATRSVRVPSYGDSGNESTEQSWRGRTCGNVTDGGADITRRRSAYVPTLPGRGAFPRRTGKRRRA